MLMHIPKYFVTACNIQIVIRIFYHSFETLLLLSLCYFGPLVYSGPKSRQELQMR